MTSWAVTFLVIAIVAALLGVSVLAGTAATVAWWCAGISVILAIAISVLGRKPPE